MAISFSSWNRPNRFDSRDLFQGNLRQIQLRKRMPGPLQVDHFGQVRGHTGSGNDLFNPLAPEGRQGALELAGRRSSS